MNKTVLELTVATYDKSAKEFAKYFKGIGPRIDDIDIAFGLAGNHKNPKIVEIGCGDGRDAKEIVKLTNGYRGFDISKGMISLAQKKLPDVKFEVADAKTYNYPAKIDIVFAFASLLHLNQKEVAHVLEKVHTSLRHEGIFYISLKYAECYKKEIKKDQFGERLFYFYNPKKIKKLAGNKYHVVFEKSKKIGNTQWFEIALRK